MDLRKAVEKRCDCRRWDLKKPDWRKVIRAIDFARFTQGVGNHFGVRFIMVDDEDKIRKLADACQQPFVGKAKMLVVVASDEVALERSYGDRANDYCRKHAGAVIQNFLLGLENEKLTTTWVLHYVEEQVAYILGLPGSARVEGVFPIGREQKKMRREKRVQKLDDILFFGKWGEKKMEPQVHASYDAA